MAMNVLNKEGDKEKYQNYTFTEEGFKILHVYLQNLAAIYLNEEVTYPFKQGIVLGLPQMKNTQMIKSKEELFGRIQCLMMILAQKEVSVQLENGSIVKYSFGGE